MIDTQLQTFLNNIISYKIAEIQTIKGTSVKGKEFMEFYPDEEILQNQIAELFYDCRNE